MHKSWKEDTVWKVEIWDPSLQRLTSWTLHKTPLTAQREMREESAHRFPNVVLSNCGQCMQLLKDGEPANVMALIVEVPVCE